MISGRPSGGLAGLVVLAAALAGCGSTATDDATMPAPTGSTPQPPLTAGPPSEADLSPGWDEAPDGPSPVADADLDGAALTALLRTRSSAEPGAGGCRPDDVTARLAGFDAALGHRYTSIVVRNDSDRSCVVAGVPGLGARGAWGHRFTLTVEPGVPASGRSEPVMLAPGDSASAVLEWTGELAGHDAERASMLVVQVAAGQVPVRVPAELTGAPDGEALDIGMLSTLRISPFEPAQGGS